MTLSCAIICKNEEHNVLDFTDNLKRHEINNLYITDTGSTDSTLKLFADNWPHDKLYVSTLLLNPFDFSAARNNNRDKILKNEQWILHLDIDERIVSLPKKLETNTVYHCTRREQLWGTTSLNISRLTPAHDWWWKHPIHESLEWNNCNYGTTEQCHDFIIDHLQKKSKNFYTDLTKEWFPHDTKRLFYHRICDLVREEQWHDLICIFDQYYSTAETHLTSQQSWQVIRNYQMSRIKCGKEPDINYLSIFHKNCSQSSLYYLSFFYYYLGDIELSRQYASSALAANDEVINTEFYNKNIKNYVHRLLNN